MIRDTLTVHSSGNKINMYVHGYEGRWNSGRHGSCSVDGKMRGQCGSLCRTSIKSGQHMVHTKVKQLSIQRIT